MDMSDWPITPRGPSIPDHQDNCKEITTLFPKFTGAITREKKTRFFPTLSLVDAFVQHSIVA
jgi:hypothetical protein